MATGRSSCHTDVLRRRWLCQHAAAEPVFGKHCSASLAHIADLQQSNSSFIANIKEDMATGSTPRKKVWNVPSAWQLTGSRDHVLERHRIDQAEGRAESYWADAEDIAMESLEDGPRNEEAQGAEVESAAASPTTPSTVDIPSLDSLALPSPEIAEQENLPPAAEVLSQSSREPSPNDTVKPAGMPRPAAGTKSRQGASNIGRLNSSQLGRSKLGTSEDREIAALGDAGTNANTGIPVRRARRAA
jgi:kinesin family protein 11